MRQAAVFSGPFSVPTTVTCGTMNAAAPRRTTAVLRAFCAIVPAVLAASHLPNVADAAHDRGVCRVLGLHAQPWRMLDTIFGVLFAVLPLGTWASRAALGGALVTAAAGVLLYDITRRLLLARFAPSNLSDAVAAVSASTALVGAPWQVEAVSVGSSVVGATLILFVVGLLMHAADDASPQAWRIAAASLGLALGQEPSAFASAAAAGLACVGATSRGRASLLRAVRADKKALAAAFAAGLIPLFLALVQTRLRGSICGSAAFEGWGREAVPWTASPLAFARQEIGPVLALLAGAGAAIAVLTERGRPAAAGMTAVVVAGALCGAMGAPMGPRAFAAPVLASCGAIAALAGMSMFAIVHAVSMARIPLARTAAALFVVLELVVPVEAADEALVRGAKSAAGTASSWDDVAWGALEPRTVVLTDDDRVRERAFAADVQALLRSDIVVAGGPQSGIHSGPFATDLVPLWRDLALSGAPSEASLSALASVRPVVASYDVAWGAAVGRHLVPMEIFERLEPEPRAASDRRRALEAFALDRQAFKIRLDGDPELLATTASLLTARAKLLAFIGERDLSERAASDAQAFERP
jgi:hypothetical protein